MLDESLKQLASRFEDIAPEEDKKPLLVLVEPSGTERKKHINPLESDLRRYTDLSDDWDDQPDTQGEIKIWIPEDLGQPKEISILKESLSRIDGIACYTKRKDKTGEPRGPRGQHAGRGN